MMNNKTLLVALLVTSSFTGYAATESCQTVTSEPKKVETPAQTLNQYEQTMIGKTWVTTEALNQKGEKVDSSDPQVSNYFGIAEYFIDGTFKMLTPDGKPKLQGQWSMSEDGLNRTLIAKDATGKTLFTRTVENIKVTPEEYTYRIYPTADSKKEYFDIVHKPQ